jgi:hypothetical protein
MLLLVYTSSLFVLPAALGFIFKKHWFFILYGSLALVSSVFHYTKNRSWLYLDYPLCYLITVLLAHESIQQSLVPLFFLGGGFVFTLFWGGWMTRRLVFSPNKNEKLFAHSLMHLIVNFSACALLLNGKTPKKF